MAILPLNKTDFLNNSAGAPLWLRTKRGFKTTGLDRRVKPNLAYTMEDIYMHQTILRNDWGTPYFGIRHTRLYADFVSSPQTGSLAKKAYETAYNAAYSRFSSAVGGRAENLTAIMEARKTVSMVERRLLGLAKAWKAWRNRDVTYLYGKGLVKPRQRKLTDEDWRTGVKTPGSLWLEFWMGWAPTVGDIQTGCEILTREFPLSLIRGSGKGSVTYADPVPNTFLTHKREKWEGMVKVYLQAQVRVSNPNLYLANQLGLVNPPLSVWQTVPWTWLLGWVVNVEQVLSSYTEFMGLTLERKLFTVKASGAGSAYFQYVQSYPKMSSCNNVLDGVSLVRQVNTLGPSPTLAFKWPAKLSVTRALTAASLLGQQLNQPIRR